MKGIDTNVLVRYLVQDDAAQVRAANHFIETVCTEEDPGFISHVVLCEITWVLESNYHQARDKIAGVIELLLQVGNIEVMSPDVVWRALEDFRQSNADFADHLVARSHEACGCNTTVTFDKKAAKQTGFTLLVNAE